jgi:transcriptional regulator NrdR family protein
VYVAFRSPHPEEETVKDVLREMQDSNIDVEQLEKWSANHCQKVESSTKEEVPCTGAGVGNGKHPSAISNNLG